ncbi:MAG: hypothetical protein AAGB02_03225 [Pseudomonadota bacterium]
METINHPNMDRIAVKVGHPKSRTVVDIANGVTDRMYDLAVIGGLAAMAGVPVLAARYAEAVEKLKAMQNKGRHIIRGIVGP